MDSKFVVFLIVAVSSIKISEQFIQPPRRKCPENYFPVCGTDGNTYDNYCYMKLERQTTKRNIRLAHRGPCEQKQCNKACPYIYSPVCGSNGKTYDNECLLKAEACEFGIELKIMKDSFCEQQKPKKCNKACPYTYFPVCASNGKIYDNECLLKAEACESGVKLKIMKDSFCVKHEPKKCFGGCPFIYLPVCASNGITYSNRCVMKYQACELGENLAVVKIGPC